MFKFQTYSVFLQRETFSNKMSIFIKNLLFRAVIKKKNFFLRFRAPLILFSFVVNLFSFVIHPFSCGLKQFSCVIHIYPSNYSTKQKIEFKHVIFCKQFVVLYLIIDFLSTPIYSLIIDLDQKDHYKNFGLNASKIFQSSLCLQ